MSQEGALQGSVPLVLVLRGSLVESAHFGVIAVADSEGTLLSSLGDPGTTTNVRSAAKPFQAHPLLTSDVADDLADEEVALVCSSHLGEPFHVRTAHGLLKRSGSTVDDLYCGAHAPGHGPSAAALEAAGEEPTSIHNNCSGKHAGMLLASQRLSLPKADYWVRGGAFQRRVLSYVGLYLGLPEERIDLAVDGCALPSFHVPLHAMATGYARLVEDDGSVFPLSPENHAARRRIAHAMRTKPEYVRGTGSLTTALMRFFLGVLLAKEGAEGFYAMGLPATHSGRVRRALGLPEGPPRAVGIALKIADGQERGRPPAILEALRQLDVLPRALDPDLAAWHRPEVRNVRGDLVGEVRAAFTLKRSRV